MKMMKYLLSIIIFLMISVIFYWAIYLKNVGTKIWFFWLPCASYYQQLVYKHQFPFYISQVRKLILCIYCTIIFLIVWSRNLYLTFIGLLLRYGNNSCFNYWFKLFYQQNYPCYYIIYWCCPNNCVCIYWLLWISDPLQYWPCDVWAIYTTVHPSR